MTILTVILVLIGILTLAIMLWQVSERRRQTEVAELAATYPPKLKVGSRVHGHEGVTIRYKVVALGEAPIKLEKVCFLGCDTKDPNQEYPVVEKKIAFDLSKEDEPFTGKLLCPRDYFETEKTKNDQNLKGYHLFRSIGGKLCIYYHDFKGRPCEKCENIETLM